MYMEEILILKITIVIHIMLNLVEFNFIIRYYTFCSLYKALYLNHSVCSNYQIIQYFGNLQTQIEISNKFTNIFTLI